MDQDSRFPVRRWLFAFCMLLWGCTEYTPSPINTALQAKEQSMASEFNTALRSQVIPPIDAAAPEVFETATFGLG